MKIQSKLLLPAAVVVGVVSLIAATGLPFSGSCSAGAALNAAGASAAVAAPAQATFVNSETTGTQPYVLLEFTGSDWCPPCMALEREVLSQEKFQQVLGDKIEFVKLDFPKRKEQSAEVKAHNRAMASKYSIEAFPTLIMTDRSGKELGRIVGYPGEEKVYGFIAKHSSEDA